MFKKRHPPVGARPGTLMIGEDALPPRITVINYTPQQVTEADDLAVPDLQEWLDRDGIAWIDVQGFGDRDALLYIAKVFSIHNLALEDVVNVPQRPKAEPYDAHQLYVSRMVRLVESGEVEMEQVCIFWSDQYVLTFQERYGDVLDPVRIRLRQGLGPMRRSGPDYLAYAVIDTIIDHYYPVLETISEELESLETLVLERPTNETLGAINRVKRVLLDLRRGIWPQRDAINSLVRGDSGFVSETVRVYLRDSYDHVVQITDVIETYRELAAGLFNTYLSAVSNRMNEVMKVLTVMASIFIPLTFLAGIYGMNFESMPELHVWWAYPLLLVIMVVTALGMIIFFQRRGWIGTGRDRDER